MRLLGTMRPVRRSLLPTVFLSIALCTGLPAAQAQSAYVRVSQVGYELGQSAHAYLMSTAAETGATFKVQCADGSTAYSGKIGALLGTWANSKKLVYQVYALDFVVPAGRSYSISVSGPVSGQSPKFAVDRPNVLYPGLLLNTLFFYQSQRDGPDFIPNALRTAPGHLKDEDAELYLTPPLDANDEINNVPPAKPLSPANLPNIDASGGWWDAGDYEKYVETMSYTVAMMEIGVRDFPNQMGPGAPLSPPAPPNSVSYAGDSGRGAPQSTDFSSEARFGLAWLLKMWRNGSQPLAYQVDNTQDWNYYGEGNPTSAAGNCGGTYNTPYCLITEYDIWTLPQAADNYLQPGDPKPCDPLTTFYICNRPVYVAPPGNALISPNLAGRLAADFAVCYQLNRRQDPALANQCLQAAEEVFAHADTHYPDPAPSVDSGSCPTCLLTIAPFDGYPETVWDDDMELGASELYLALSSAQGNVASGLPVTDPNVYLKQAAQFAGNYINDIYKPGYTDTLNLYDVSGLAHFELYQALKQAGDPGGLAVSQQSIKQQLLAQTNAAITQASSDPWGFGVPWSNGDTTSHGAGLSVMASEAYSLTGAARYNTYACVGWATYWVETPGARRSL
jgi:endoglucanase